MCGLRFEQRPGDIWAFWIIGDRLFIAATLAVIVLGFRSTSASQALGLFLAASVPLIWTWPHRLGFCVGLDYLSRVYFGQPSDVPPFADEARPDEARPDEARPDEPPGGDGGIAAN